MTVPQKRIFADIPGEQFFIQSEDEEDLETHAACRHDIENGDTVVIASFERDDRSFQNMSQQLDELSPGENISNGIELNQCLEGTVDSFPHQAKTVLAFVRLFGPGEMPAEQMLKRLLQIGDASLGWQCGAILE
jgi:3'-phosphoadenosine 5'-phosphosulfate (PAPS) 3'-phosphatase